MLFSFLQQGGPLMWPLLACSVALAAVLTERSWAHARRHGAHATQRRGGPPSPAASARSARPGIHPFFWEIPPQIGLLGTVIGLVQIFRGGLGPEAFGRGVGVACLTTVFGLGLALVARSADHLFTAWSASNGKIKGDNTLFAAGGNAAEQGSAKHHERVVQRDAPDGSNSLFPEPKRESDPEPSALRKSKSVPVGAAS